MSSSTPASMPPASSTGVPSGPPRPSSSSGNRPRVADRRLPARSSAPPPALPESGHPAISENDLPTPEAAGLPAVLTADELAALLRVDRKTVYGLITRGDIPGVRRLGKTIRISRDAVLRWLSEGQGRVSRSRGSR